jgi:hypothetical protein
MKLRSLGLRWAPAMGAYDETDALPVGFVE